MLVFPFLDSGLLRSRVSEGSHPGQFQNGRSRQEFEGHEATHGISRKTSGGSCHVMGAIAGCFFCRKSGKSYKKNMIYRHIPPIVGSLHLDIGKLLRICK